MPYKKITELPDRVKDNLPKHAQEIYKESFNNAEKQYKDKSDTEKRAHKVAWHAVKQKYEKGNDGKWHSKR